MTPETEGVLRLTVILSLVGGVVGVLYYVWYALALSKLFVKLGAESWRGWVPVLNEMEILGRGGVPGWSVVYYFIPVVNLYGLYLKITAVHRINLQLGRGGGSTALAILLPPVWASILAWGATRPVAGVDDRRVEGGLAGGDAPSHPAATGPLAAPAPVAAPFAPVASDASGYALPVVQPPPVVAGPAFSAPPPAPAPVEAAAGGPPAPPAARPAEGLIPNPWAQPAPAAATPPPPPAAPGPPAPPTAGPPAPPAPAAPPVASGYIVPPPSIGLPPTAASSASVPTAAAPPTAVPPTAAPAFEPTPVVFAPDNGGDDDLDNTIVVDRRPVVPWRLRTDDGFVASLTATRIVLGRNPSSADPDVQAIAIPDSTKTLSKTHARLDLVDGAWSVTDLHSTNGVVVIGQDGVENLIDVDQTVPLQARFLLGKVGMAVSFEEEQRS